MAAGIPGRIPYARPLAVGAALLALYLLLGFFAAPPLLKRVLTHNVAETLKRKVRVGEVAVNPLTLSVELKDFALTETDGAPIAAFRRLLADFQLSSLFRRAWTFSEISLEGLELRADIAPGGRFNLLALLEDLPKAERKADDRPPRVLLQRMLLAGGSFTFSDRSIPAPASATLAPIDLEVHDLSTIPDALGNYAVRLRLPAGGTLEWRGEATLQPLASRGEITVKAIKPITYWRFIGYRFAELADPQGELDFAAHYRFAYAAGAGQLDVEGLRAAGRGLVVGMGGEKGASLALASLELSEARAALSTQAGKPWRATLAAPKIAAAGLEFIDRSRATPYAAAIKEARLGFGAAAEGGADEMRLKLEKLDVTLNGVSAGEPGAARPMGELDSVALEGGSLDLAERLFGAARLHVAGGELRVVREKDGSLPLLKILSPSDEGVLRRGLGGAAKEAKAEGKPWRAKLEELLVEGTRVALSDLSFGAPIAYDVRDLRLSAKGIDTEDKAPLKFEAALQLEQGGSLAANGEARITGKQAELRAKLDRVSLKPLQPAVATRARVVLQSGDVSADLKAAYRQAGGAHALRLGGTLRVDNVLVNETASGERLLAWRSLSAKGLSLGLAPDRFRIEEASLQGLGAKIVVFKDRSTNLGNALVLAPADAGAQKAALTTADTEALFPVAVDRVRIADGAADFADLSLVFPFGAKVHKLNGVVDGVSTDRASRASLKLEGQVDEYGLARAEGSLRPFRPTSFMDIAVTFRNVDMPPLSPYSATFAGRRIASGKLSLDLAYKIDEGRLAGDNRVLLEKFTLGEKVESPDAVSLPLDLAVALLTDSDGRIDLAVPVTGDVNDPQFGYGALVWQAIKTVIGKIVSAPFRALGSLFGGGSETLESIAFDPGRAALLGPEQEKLKRVAEGLAKRPQIRLVAEGQAGGPDRAALARRDVALAVGAKLGRAPGAGGEPDPVNVTEAKTQRALEAVFAERNSADALNKFAADTAKARGKDVQRANAMLALIGNASADRDFYEALLKRLNETARVPDEALAQLAERRAQAVGAHMTTVLAFPAARTATRTAKSPGEAQVRLELELESAAAK